MTQAPPGWRNRRSSPILQGYLSAPGAPVEVRLRRVGTRHFLTLKRGQGQRRFELEVPISPKVFEAAWPLTERARVAKQRYRLHGNGALIELDVYQGAHRGLMVGEVEFDSAQASRAFRPPSWLGVEVTGDARYANAQLARERKLPTPPRRNGNRSRKGQRPPR